MSAMLPKVSLVSLKQAAALPLLLLALAIALAACGNESAPTATDSAATESPGAVLAAADPAAAAPPTVNVANSAPAVVPSAAAQSAAPPAAATAAALPDTPTPPLRDSDIMAAWEKTLTAVYDEVLPSVVYIRVRTPADALPDNFLFREQLPDGLDEFFWGQGSGFVWDDQGHIVTNYHVVDGADQVTVYFPGAVSVRADVVGADPHSDLAVIKVDPDGWSARPAILGDSNQVRPGHLAMAIGAPFGQEFSITSGIVSAVGRLMAAHTQFSIPEVIQTDVALNPGNSGGPLLDRQGRVIGVNTSILTQTGAYSGVGMAVPVNIARRVVRPSSPTANTSIPG